MVKSGKIKSNLRYRGFSKGIGNVKVSELHSIRATLKAVLNISSRQGLDYYISGKTEVRAWQRTVIENVFREYGITNPNDIWDA